MSSSRWLTSKIPSREIRALEVMHNLRLSMTRKTLGHELRVVDDMKDFGSRAQGFRYYEQLKVVVDMNNSRS